MPCYKRTIKAGEIIEYEIYHAIRKRDLKGIIRGERRGLSDEKQKQLNQINRERHCWRLLNTNFQVGDLYITLTHKKSLTEEETLKEQKNFIRRLTYYRRKNNLPELKYMAATELSDRWHTHIVINRMDMEEVMRIWGKGMIDFSPLYIDEHFKRLAHYIKKENKKGKHWSQSRNLKQPKIEVKPAAARDIRRMQAGKTPVPPQGYRETYRELRDNDITGTSMYFRYERVPIRSKNKCSKRG